MISGSLLYLVSEWVVRLGMIPVVIRRRVPIVATVWLLVIFFQPWIGLILYLLLGENRLPRRRIRRHARALGLTSAERRGDASRPHATRPSLPGAENALVILAERLGEMPIVGGNRVELLTDVCGVIDRLLADIDAARHHVHLEFYIFQDDATGRRVADALVRAVERGVRCRLLADSVGSWGMLKTLAPRLRKAGVQVHAMLPVNPLRRRLARLDLRNHRKLALIDGRVAYTGSQNVVDATYGHRKLRWHDVTARVIGPMALQLQSVFLEDWFFDTGEHLGGEELFPEPPTDGPVAGQTLPSGPTYPTENYQRFVVAAIYAARRCVRITTPYLVPDEALLQAFQVATLRGVRVQLVVPRRSDLRLVDAAARAYFGELLEMGVELYTHDRGLLHAKTMTVDDAVALLGSGNFDIRSFYLNFELNLLVYGPQVTGKLYRVQQRFLDAARPVDATEWKARPALLRAADDAVRLLSPLL